MKTLQIDENNARKLYKTGAPEFKITLEDTFGKEFFSQSVIDRVKSYEDACREIGEEPVNEVLLKVAGFTDDEINYRKLKSITKALNEGWKPDWDDSNERKWFPWFTMSSSGFAFFVAYYYYSCTAAGGGARLCFKSSELAEYAGRQFSQTYKGFMI
ncbi:MAG: hypothetical protein V1775_18265 [Bacteroidota bacterium]